MKLLIVSDLEGISGVVNEKIQALPGAPLYEEARNFLMSDLNSAIEGALKGGADEAVVLDSHCAGTNIKLEQLNKKAKAILGNPHLIPGDFIKQFDAKILIGYHAMAETENALLAHTYPLEIKYIKVNGLKVGEIGMEILIASYLDIPTILVTGDSAAEIETKKLIPDISFVTVKDVLGSRSASCRNLSETAKNIKEAAQKAVLNYKQAKLLKIKGFYILETVFYDEAFAQKVFSVKKYYEKKIEGCKIIVKGENLYQLWTNFKDAIWANL